MTTRDTLAYRLKFARQSKGLSQAELAKATGISQAAVAAIESERNKSSTNIAKFATILGVSPIWLETGKNETEINVNQTLGSQFGDNTTISGGQNDFSITQNVQKNFENEEIKKSFAILTDNSMSPVLPIGSEVWLEIAEEIQNQKIYYIEYGGEKMYRQLFRLPENRIRIKAYNPEFDEFIVDSDKIRVIGRVSEWHVKNQ